MTTDDENKTSDAIKTSLAGHGIGVESVEFKVESESNIYKPVAIFFIKAMITLMWLVSVRQVFFQLPGTNMVSQWASGFLVGAMMVPCMSFLLVWPVTKLYSFAYDHSAWFKAYSDNHWGNMNEEQR